MAEIKRDSPETRVGDTYSLLKTRVVGFGIRPGERLNEVALARELGVSRTPLREALNRLLAERLIDFTPGTGFICRPLDPKTIFDLYEMRQVIEVTSIRLAILRASDDELRGLRADLLRDGIDVTGLTVAEAVQWDEAFHMAIARLSGNGAMVHTLERLNDQIRFIRCVGMAARVTETKAQHRAMAEAVLARRADKAADIMADHIGRRMDQVVEAVKEGLSSIYMDGAEALGQRVLEDE